MKKLLLIFAAIMMASTGLFAQARAVVDDIKYIDADGVEQTANNVTVITPNTTTLTEGWYLVIEANTSTLVCTGAVHLILFDAAILTATGEDGQPGIKVSGDGNSLTIYGQANQTGQLIANGGNNAAGIGGGESGSGSNITINGGVVTANGGWNAAGIGSGDQGSAASNIFVATTHIVKAGDAANPTEVIAPNRTATTDIASDLAGKRYVTIQLDLTPYKTAAIAEIDAAIEGVTDEYITTIAADAKTNITNARIIGVINSVKTLAIAKINAIKEINDAIEGVTDEYITTIAADAKTNITNAGTTAAINAIKTLALAKIAAIKEIIAAIKDLTLFSAEESYIDAIKSYIQQDDDANLINGDKQLGLDYIALHDAKLAAVAAVRHDMGDYAESEAIYNFIGGPAIEGAVDAVEITEAKNAAIAKLEEYSEILGAANMVGYNKGKEEGIEEALGTMGTPCEDCPAVEVKKGEKTIILYNPESVTFKKVE